MSVTDHRSDTGPFASIPEWLLDTPISDGAIRQYLILTRYADNETGEAWPSRSTLAERQGCSTDTVDRRNRELVEAGGLVMQPRFDDAGDRTSNRYFVVRVRPGARDVAGTGPCDDAATGPREDAAQNLTHSELEPSELPTVATRPPRARFVEFDALVAVFGEPGTADESKFYAKIAHALKRDGKSPDDIRARGLEAQRRWPDCSPAVVSNRWSQLAPRRPAPGSTLDDVAARDAERLRDQ